MQMTLGGKPITDDSFAMYQLYQLARRNPERFANYCRGQGITYHGKPSVSSTFFCLAELEKHFNFPITTEMLDAMAKYAATKPAEPKIKIVHYDDPDQVNLLNFRGEEYGRPEETNLGEDTKVI